MSINLNQISILNPIIMGGGVQDAQAFAYLTPDALMDYCATRLRGIDSQVQKAFAQQEMTNHDSSVMSNLETQLSLPDHTLDLNNEADFTKGWDSAQAMLAAADKCEDPQTKSALQAAANKLLSTLKGAFDDMQGGSAFMTFASDGDIKKFFEGDPQNNIPPTKIGNTSKTMATSEFQQATTDAVKSIQQDASSCAELNMIQLQSLMSQRQSAVQMCTNLVQSLGDQMDKIAQNIGH